jgi:uncharacterized PurR-regulated membrane protein YhhQ (DUF165 family)
LFNGDIIVITIASALSFGISESADTEIYTRLGLPLEWRVFWSGAVGGLLDSIVFILIGLSPLTTGIISWQFIAMAMMGQVIIKVSMQGLGAMAVRLAWK